MQVVGLRSQVTKLILLHGFNAVQPVKWMVVAQFKLNRWGETTGEPILTANSISPGSRGSAFAKLRLDRRSPHQSSPLPNGWFYGPGRRPGTSAEWERLGDNIPTSVNLNSRLLAAQTGGEPRHEPGLADRRVVRIWEHQPSRLPPSLPFSLCYNATRRYGAARKARAFTVMM
jgi:hypothetical protein